MANVATLTFSGRTMAWLKYKGTGAEAVFGQWGDSTVTAAANANVNCFKPQTEARATGTTSLATTTFLGDTYKNIVTITCLVGAKTITELALFDSATASSTGTLAASLTASATSMTLGAVPGVTAGNAYMQVENETILATLANSATLTVTRGRLGSTSAVHASGVPVTIGGDGGAGANGATSEQTATINAAAGGNCFLHADHAGVGLAVNDSIAYTVTVTLT